MVRCSREDVIAQVSCFVSNEHVHWERERDEHVRVVKALESWIMDEML